MFSNLLTTFDQAWHMQKKHKNTFAFPSLLIANLFDTLQDETNNFFHCKRLPKISQRLDLARNIAKNISRDFE